MFSNLLSGNDLFADILCNGNVIFEQLLSNGRLALAPLFRFTAVMSQYELLAYLRKNHVKNKKTYHCTKCRRLPWFLSVVFAAVPSSLTTVFMYCKPYIQNTHCSKVNHTADFTLHRY
jgi:hypothetical protein